MDQIPFTDEYRSAKSSLEVHASNHRAGLEVLFADWQRCRTAGARHASSGGTDPLDGITFGDAVEAVLTSRITGTALDIHTTTAPAKRASK